jgi:hypothetical protein
VNPVADISLEIELSIAGEPSVVAGQQRARNYQPFHRFPAAVASGYEDLVALQGRKQSNLGCGDLLISTQPWIWEDGEVSVRGLPC